MNFKKASFLNLMAAINENDTDSINEYINQYIVAYSRDKIFDLLMAKNIICIASVKILTTILERLYKTGDEVLFYKKIIDGSSCIPIENVRYLLLYVANKQHKVDIYYSLIAKGRFKDLEKLPRMGEEEAYSLFSIVKHKYTDRKDRDEVLSFLHKKVRKTRQRRTYNLIKEIFQKIN